MIMVTKYTKDELIKVILKNQKTISSQIVKNTEAFEGVKGALETLNDNNVLHNASEDVRNVTVAKLVAGNEKFYKTINYILMVLVAALVILAGAEKALKFFPNL
jgi:uncharacterized surface anchored protein